jgi:hypothetical protein
MSHRTEMWCVHLKFDCMKRGLTAVLTVVVNTASLKYTLVPLRVGRLTVFARKIFNNIDHTLTRKESMIRKNSTNR